MTARELMPNPHAVEDGYDTAVDFERSLLVAYGAIRSEDYDPAVAQVWVLYCAGLPTEAETTRRHAELRRIRENVAKAPEKRAPLS